MKLHHILFPPLLLLAALLAAGCNDALEAPLAQGGNGNVTFRLSFKGDLQTTRGNLFHTYDSTRTNSALGALSNCRLGTDYALRYQVEVWDADGQNRVADRVTVVDNYEDVVSIQFQLFPDHRYRVVAWADLVRPDAPESDLHYDTRDLRQVRTLDPPEGRLGDESRDAYWTTETFDVGQATKLMNLVLRRPLAKLRIVTTDWKSNNLGMPDSLELQYRGCRRHTGMNALTGELLPEYEDERQVLTGRLDTDRSPYRQGYDLQGGNRTLLTDYLFVDTAQQFVHFNLKAYDHGIQKINPSEEDAGRTFNTEIPLRRNYLTTLIGNALTTGNNIRALCFEAFYRDEVIPTGTIPWDAIVPLQPQIRPTNDSLVFPPDVVAYEHTSSSYHITRIEEWKWLFEKEGGWDFSHDHGLVKTVDIDADLNFANITDVPTMIVHHPYTINGNGHVISNISQTKATLQKRGTSTQNAAYLGVLAFMEPAVVKDLTFENITLAIPRRLGRNDWEWTARQLYAAPIASMDRASSYIRTCRLENVHSRHVTIYTPEGDDLGVAFTANKKKKWRDVVRYYVNKAPKDGGGVQFFFYGRLDTTPGWEDTSEKSRWNDHNCFTWPGFYINSRAYILRPGWESAMTSGDELKKYQILLDGSDSIPPQDFESIYGIERCVRSWVTGGLVGLAQGILFKGCSATDIRCYTNRNFGGLVGENMYCHYENNHVEEVKVFTSRRVDINLCKDIYTGKNDMRHYWAPVTGAIHWLIGLNNVTPFSYMLLDPKYWNGKESWHGNQFSGNTYDDYTIYDPEGYVNKRYVRDDAYQPILPLNDTHFNGVLRDCEYYHYDQGKPKEYWGWTYDRRGAKVDNTFANENSPLWVDPESLVLYDPPTPVAWVH